MLTTSPAHIFAYGTLVDPRCLDEVLGRRHTGEWLRARLPGYQRIESPAYPYPFVVPAADSAAVDGVLIMDLSAADLQLLDRYEDVDLGLYRRELVDVEAWGCGPRPLRVQASAYVAGPRLIAATSR